jgi:hypothetical protein
LANVLGDFVSVRVGAASAKVAGEIDRSGGENVGNEDEDVDDLTLEADRGGPR